MLSVTLLGSGPLGPAQALAPQALREPPQPQPPCSRPPATPQAPSPLREPLPPTDGQKFPLCSIGHCPIRVRCPA